MKHLIPYIKESLFDTEKNVTDEHEIEKNMFYDFNSQFWKYLIPLQSNGDVHMWDSTWNSMEKEIDISKNIISIPDIYVQLDTRVDNPFANKYELICKEFRIGLSGANGPHPDPVNNGGGFKEIRCDRVQIDGFCEKLAGFKFVIVNKGMKGTRAVTIKWAGELDYFDAEFDFLDNSNSVFACSESRGFPNLKNVKSNAKCISVYDCSFFDCPEVKTKLDKFFGAGKLEANGVVKNKSIRNIVAIANNIRKYGAIIPTQVIPEGKLSDLIDVSGFKDLETIRMKSNNVMMSFCRPDNQAAILRHARFVRLNNMKLYRDSSEQDMVELVKSCQTKDGWVLMIEPEHFG